MADIQVILEVLGAEDMEKAARATVTLTNKVDSLGKQLKKGVINNKQFQSGVQQLIKKNKELGGGYQNLQKDVQRYAFSMQRRINDEKRAEAALESVIRTTNNYTQATNRATVATTSAAEAAARHAAAQRMSGKSTNRFGMYAQQVGYQVGDFFVQVQSGTNAMVAFGQQGTQLAGLLPGVAGAVLGIGLSVGTMLAGAFMRTRGEAKDFATELEGLENIISGLTNTQDILSMSTRELTQKYGDAAKAVKQYAIVEAQLQSSLAKSALKDSLSTLDQTVTKYTEATKVADEFGQGFSLDISENLRQIERDFGKVGNEAQLLRSSLELVGTALTFEDQQFAVENLLKNFDLLGITLQDIPKPVAEMLLNFIKANRTIQEAEELIRALEGAVDDSANGVRGITANLSDAVSEAIKLRDAMSAVGRASLGRQDQIKVLTSQIAAARAGTNVEVAKTGTETALELARGGASVDQIAAAVQKAQQEEATIQSLSGTLSDLTKPSSGGAAKAQEDYLAKLQQEADRKLELIGLSEQEARVKEIIFQLQDKGLPVEQERIDTIIATEEAIRKATEAEQQREQLMQTVTSNIESAFMSVVDGSKSVEDAFRSMLRNIILAIYQQKVAEPAANAIGSLIDKGIAAIFSANGNVFNQGMHVKAYADGGVVNRATAFPMRGGVGIMGEAGPEAIMPLKRGKNGKLGVQMEGSGGGAVTIHQSFNFSANGDESVKRIIRGEVPRITEATKAAVLDAKRRGGSYGRSF